MLFYVIKYVIEILRFAKKKNLFNFHHKETSDKH